MSDELNAGDSIEVLTDRSVDGLRVGVVKGQESAPLHRGGGWAKREDRSVPAPGCSIREIKGRDYPFELTTPAGTHNYVTREWAVWWSWDWYDTEHPKAPGRAGPGRVRQKCPSCSASWWRDDHEAEAAALRSLLEDAFESYCRSSPDPDHIPEPWAEAAADFLGGERASEIHYRAQMSVRSSDPEYVPAARRAVVWRDIDGALHETPEQALAFTVETILFGDDPPPSRLRFWRRAAETAGHTKRVRHRLKRLLRHRDATAGAS